MKKKDFKPLAALYGYISGSDQMTFIGRTGRVVLNGNTKIIMELLKLCNGRRLLSDIYEKIDADKPLLESIAMLLVNNGVIVDGCSLHTIFHRDSSNPTLFQRELSLDDIRAISELPKKIINGEVYILPQANGHLLNLVRMRKSVRSFQEGVISDATFSGLLESLYKTGDTRSVPSGGGLYSLGVHIALLRDVGSLGQGLYRYSSDDGSIIKTTQALDERRVSWLLDSDSVTNNAVGVIFITADIEKVAKKYSNRGYRHVMLEAGHAAQNAYLYCAEAGLGTVEWGGFKDFETEKFLNLDYPNEIVTTALIFGVPGNGNCFAMKSQSDKLESALVGHGKPIASVHVGFLTQGAYTAPVTIAKAKYRPASACAPKNDDERYVAFGKGVSVAEARVKAMAEAFERYSSGVVRVDWYASESSLELPVLDLCKIAPVRGGPANKKRDMESRGLHTKWGWVRASRLLTGEQLLVPVDQVFYPLYRGDAGHAPQYLANSSGVAAHSDKDLAIENATLELVERDAIATLWYGRRSVSAIPLEHSSVDEVRERVCFWISRSKRVKILNITTDTVPVVLVLISGPAFPCLASGAAAAYTFAEAVSKAFEEAEVMLLSWQDVMQGLENPEEVVSVRDHGKLYFGEKHISRLDWLFSVKEVEPRVFCGDAPTLFQYVNPAVVEITPHENSPLVVVRVMSERLMPLTFGYGNEHVGHPRLDVLSCHGVQSHPAFPHFFS